MDFNTNFVCSTSCKLFRRRFYHAFLSVIAFVFDASTIASHNPAEMGLGEIISKNEESCKYHAGKGTIYEIIACVFTMTQIAGGLHHSF